MISPYKEHLKRYFKGQVTLHRRDALDISGEVIDVDDFGCKLKQPGQAEYDTEVFVSYEDIRGVAIQVVDSGMIH
ncbi:hypothetical protein H7X65_03775 [Candidatus Parcubacteria bacterium]|nr:hypothetical protein [Candidatus Parcubacteria bacterium]